MSMLIHMKLLNGETLDFSVKEKSVTIGRSAKCNIVVPHEGMSRQHCLLEFENSDIYITDLASTNGVFINGERIEPNVRIRYATYLSLSFGAVQSMTIDLEDKTSAGMKIQEKPEIPVPIETPQTKTKLVAPRPEATEQAPRATYKPQYLHPKENRIQSFLLNILALFIVLAAVYWYVTKDEEVLPENVPEIEMPSSP